MNVERIAAANGGSSEGGDDSNAGARGPMCSRPACTVLPGLGFGVYGFRMVVLSSGSGFGVYGSVLGGVELRV